ncbi:MAG TPA: PepSY-associated TM helix domain-containing protein [Pyrinomonadaceae bacterium]|nr:PepSY-associated TM helix domain-containing protein [Pyrinomonadaceae bacterium]
MKRLRKIIFWCHLPLGVTGGVIILVMAVTGVLLTYEKQMIAWADNNSSWISTPSPATVPVPIDTLIANAQKERTSAPTAVTRRADPTSAIEVGFGRDAPVFVNPYTGEIVGSGSQRARSFFHTTTDIHRWLGAQGENRAVARAITGACNLAFLALVITGFYLWWPKTLNWRAVKRIIWFRRKLRGQARDFNWHNTIGFWAAIPLFIVVISAAPISYTWAGNLVYRMVGESPPPPRAAANQQTADGRNKNAESSPKAMASHHKLWESATAQISDWRSISMRVPAANDGRVVFTLDKSDGGQPQNRAQLTFDRQSGAVVAWEPFATYSRGRQIRSLLRFAHTGEVAGIAGQTIAGIASAAGAFLVWTGLALAWRRLWGWRRKRSRQEAPRDRNLGNLFPVQADIEASE